MGGLNEGDIKTLMSPQKFLTYITQHCLTKGLCTAYECAMTDQADSL